MHPNHDSFPVLPCLLPLWLPPPKKVKYKNKKEKKENKQTKNEVYFVLPMYSLKHAQTLSGRLLNGSEPLPFHTSARRHQLWRVTL